MDNFRGKIQTRLEDRHKKVKRSWKKLLIKMAAFILIIVIIRGFSGERLKSILSFGKSNNNTVIDRSNE